MLAKPSQSGYSLTLELLPEFGWSIRGEPTYGPGSVFQGFVKISSQQRQIVDADSIQLRFQGVESVHPIEISPGVLRGRRHQSLFAVKHVLWKGQCLDPSSGETSVALPFTIQMPVVQYPPSIDEHEYYQCTFKLIAIVEKAGRTLQSIEKKISYRPFIETCVLKRPIDAFSGQIKLHGLEYVPGDMITATIKRSDVRHRSTSTSSSSSASSSTSSIKRIITAKLYQISMLHAVDDVPKLAKVIVSKSWDEDRDADQDAFDESYKLDLLHIPSDIIPSYSYSSIMTVSYQLKVWFKQKKLGGLWTTTGQAIEFPLTIGTLGYGVRAPTQLQIYSTMVQQQEDQSEQIPRFMRAVEYSDSLPAYEGTRLPTYHDTISS
ncbi:hypothetical protein BDA99DRAFT_507893 [Phascolomyces articulosus]|uniref:Arrestin C-terminal-like domain-containing protein n=1 Tax=Phascolomyces articulosus TaxID=60185 RepID=A0AAD5K232_9FUNG|nr:hypothetical protein BDA99DRAFT_507893 [Phascolomyces articulosus]